MASFQDQLKGVKLKKSKEPIKDYSNPKLAGFVSDEEIQNYQRSVLDVNIERWLDILKDETFPILYCGITIEEVRTFVAVYEKLFKDIDPSVVSEIAWQEKITEDQKTQIDSLCNRLQDVMNTYVKEDGYAFVKTSCRSAKDAPTAQKRFKDVYQNFLSDLPEKERKNENSQITCILKAAFEGLKVSFASEAIDMFIRSERIYQDFLLALEQAEVYCENFVVRKFVQIEVDTEFRCFVFNNSLSALSQYNYAIHSKKLADLKENVEKMIINYFEEKIRPKLEASTLSFAKTGNLSLPIDLKMSAVSAVHVGVKDWSMDRVSEWLESCSLGDLTDIFQEKIWAIEINPFLVSTDADLFSWEHERDILEGKHVLHFRITEKPRPGARVILPHSIKALLDI